MDSLAMSIEALRQKCLWRRIQRREEGVALLMWVSVRCPVVSRLQSGAFQYAGSTGPGEVKG